MFIDEVNVKFIAWKWWDWLVSWRREKYIPKWWPFWWNWWNWWDVILLASTNLNTLSDFRHKKVIKAEDWEKGKTQNMTWFNWENLIIFVPVWTLVKDFKTWEIICDLSEVWQKFVLCKWWRWGYGNSHFVSSIRQAPSFAELWDIWEEKYVKLELKLVADIWIIGFPNAWKSTLIKSITNVKPKIDDYPFTTIIPNLWVMEYKWKNLVIEDTPWLIKWASSGKWLGINFLKHIERAKVLLHLLSMEEPDNISKNYFEIRKEIELFSKNVAKKKEIIVLSKADLFDSEMIDFIKNNVQKELKVKKIFVISTLSNLNIENLKNYLIEKIDTKVIQKIQKDKTIKIYDLKNIDDPNFYKITEINDFEFEVKWSRIEQIVRMTNLKNKEAVLRIHDILDKIWVIKKISTLIKKNHNIDIWYKNKTWFNFLNKYPIVIIWSNKFEIFK